MIIYPVELSRSGADESITIYLHFSRSVVSIIASYAFSPIHSCMLTDHFSFGKFLFLMPFTVH